MRSHPILVLGARTKFINLVILRNGSGIDSLVSAFGSILLDKNLVFGLLYNLNFFTYWTFRPFDVLDFLTFILFELFTYSQSDRTLASTTNG